MNTKIPNIIDYQPTLFNNDIECYRFYNFNEQSIIDLNPDGNFEFIFQLNGNFAQRSCLTNKWVVRPQNFIGGLHSNSFQVKSLNEKSRILSVKFKPLGARSFVNDKLSLFKNQLIDLDLLNNNILKMDLEKISDQDIVQHLELSLSKTYTETKKNSIDYAMELLTQNHGFISIKNICKKLKISKSHFRLMFNEQVGMSPKEYSKILRTKHITKLLEQNPTQKLTDLAYQLEYFDQAHFIKDFRSVTGCSPGKYLKQI